MTVPVFALVLWRWQRGQAILCAALSALAIVVTKVRLARAVPLGDVLTLVTTIASALKAAHKIAWPRCHRHNTRARTGTTMHQLPCKEERGRRARNMVLAREEVLSSLVPA